MIALFYIKHKMFEIFLRLLHRVCGDTANSLYCFVVTFVVSFIKQALQIKIHISSYICHRLQLYFG